MSIALTRLMMFVHIADVPNERSSHNTITPKSGGVAIILSLFFFLVCANFYVVPIFSSYTLLLLLLASAMGMVGLLDDVFHLSYRPRLFAQMFIALFLVATGFSIDHIPLPGVEEIDLGLLGPIITIFWVVGFINTFNFMDGLNGLSASAAVAVSISILLFMPILNPFYFVFYGLIFSLFGYLRYNFHHGSIFMSDVGSQFLGSLFAIATLMVEPVTNGVFRFYIIPLLFFPFIYDATLTFFVRLLNKKNVFKSHREFLFHRLVDLGWSHTQVTCLYVGFILSQGVFVSYFLSAPSFSKLILNLLFYVIYSILVYVKTKSLYSKEESND